MFNRNMLTYANRFKLSRWNDITNAISDKCPWILSWTLLPRSWWVNCLHSRPDSWRGPWTPNWTLLPGRDEWTVYSCPDSWRRQLMQCIYSRRVRCPLFYRSDDILMSDAPISDFRFPITDVLISDIRECFRFFYMQSANMTSGLHAK